MRRRNVDLIITAIDKLETATTGEIIGFIQRQGVSPPTPRVVSQICSCLSIIEKKGMRGPYVIWGKTEDFGKKLKEKTKGRGEDRQ